MLVPWDTARVLRTLPCYVAARLSRRFSRSNLRSLGACLHYIAKWNIGLFMLFTIPAGIGGLSSHRLCGSAVAIGSFSVHCTNQWPCSYTALLKKGFSIGEGVAPSVLWRSTHSVSQGTEVTLVTEYVCHILLSDVSYQLVSRKRKSVECETAAWERLLIKFDVRASVSLPLNPDWCWDMSSRYTHIYSVRLQKRQKLYFAAVGTNCWFRLARGELSSDWAWFLPRFFFLNSVTDGVLFLAAVASGLLSCGHLISSDIVDLIAQILLELNWARWWHHWIQW